MEPKILEIKDFIKKTDEKNIECNVQHRFYFKFKRRKIFFNDKIFKILNNNNIQVHLKGNFIKNIEYLDKYFDEIMNFERYKGEIYKCRKRETDFFIL